MGVWPQTGVPRAVRSFDRRLEKTAKCSFFWSSDPESTGAIYNGQETTPWRFWLKELGVKMVFIDPFYNYTAVAHCDKWFAPRLGTDTALACAIAHVWITEDRYDKVYVETHTFGFEKMARIYCR